MNSTTQLILDSREDISDYVFHFTKSKNAFNNLISIITDGGIKDINNNGYICFSEAPLIMLPKMFEIFRKYENPLYAPYGIGIKKEFFYNLGGRPVFYGDDADYKKLDSIGLGWRFVHYIPNKLDFSWLREWRINSSKINLDPQYMFVITNQDVERSIVLNQTGNIDFDGCIEDGEFHGYALGDFELLYRQVSLECIKSGEIQSKIQLEGKLNNQIINQIETHSLGAI